MQNQGERQFSYHLHCHLLQLGLSWSLRSKAPKWYLLLNKLLLSYLMVLTIARMELSNFLLSSAVQ